MTCNVIHVKLCISSGHLVVLKKERFKTRNKFIPSEKPLLCRCCCVLARSDWLQPDAFVNDILENRSNWPNCKSYDLHKYDMKGHYCTCFSEPLLQLSETCFWYMRWVNNLIKMNALPSSTLGTWHGWGSISSLERNINGHVCLVKTWINWKIKNCILILS